MATPVQMPNVGISVESCILTKWHKKKGDQVKAGDVLFTYETDKTTTDEVAEVDGTLIDVFFDEDSDIPVMTNIAVIGTPGENTAEFAPTSAKTDTVVPAPVEKEKPQSQEAAQTAAPVVSHPQAQRAEFARKISELLSKTVRCLPKLRQGNLTGDLVQVSAGNFQYRISDRFLQKLQIFLLLHM